MGVICFGGVAVDWVSTGALKRSISTLIEKEKEEEEEEEEEEEGQKEQQENAMAACFSPPPLHKKSLQTLIGDICTAYTTMETVGRRNTDGLEKTKQNVLHR